MLPVIDIFGFDMIGVNLTNINIEDFYNISEKVVLRKKNQDGNKLNSFINLNVIDDLSLLNKNTDLFMINDFKEKNKVKKRIRKGLGIEVSFANARNLDGNSFGKWIKESRSLYKLCKSTGCQFVLSSGAKTITEIISVRSFELILGLLNIDSKSYWKEISEWLDSKDKIRVL